MGPETEGAVGGFDFLRLVGNHRKTIANLLLVVLVFFLIVRPLLRSVKQIASETIFERKELPGGPQGEVAQIPEPTDKSQRDRVVEVSKANPEKTEQLIKGWIGEGD